jgi:hypothetical protein
VTEISACTFSKNGQKAAEDLHCALEETFDCLKRLTAGAEDGHSPLTEPPYNEGSLLFIHTSLKHTPMPSKADNAVNYLRNMQSDVKKYRDKVEDAFLSTMDLYNLINSQQSRTSISSAAMVTIRDKFIRLLKLQKSRRTGTGGENRSLNGELTSAIAPDIKEVQRLPSPDIQTSSLLLQLPPELLILIISVLSEDSLEVLPTLRL